MAQEIENIQEKLNWHWRNTMRSVRFFSFDVRAAWPLPFLLVYARWSTIILTIVNLLIFYYLERRGLTVPSALRSMRSWLVGKFRPGVISARSRRFRDYG